jgi:hypothetical protein
MSLWYISVAVLILLVKVNIRRSGGFLKAYFAHAQIYTPVHILHL